MEQQPSHFSQIVLMAKLEELKRREHSLRLEWERILRASMANHWFLAAVSDTFLPIFDNASRILSEGHFDLKGLPFGDMSKLIEMQKNQFAQSMKYASAEGGIFVQIDQLHLQMKGNFSEMASQVSDDLSSEVEFRTTMSGKIQQSLSQIGQFNSRARQFLEQLSSHFQLPASAFMGLAQMMGVDPDEFKQSGEMKFLETSIQHIARLKNEFSDFYASDQAASSLSTRVFDFQEWLTTILENLLDKALEIDVEVRYNIPSTIPSQITGDPAFVGKLLNLLFSATLETMMPSFGNEGPRKFRFRVEAFEKDWVNWINFSVFELSNPGYIRYLNQLGGLPGKPPFSHSMAQPRLLQLQNLVVKIGGEFHLTDQEAKGCSMGFSVPFPQQ